VNLAAGIKELVSAKGISEELILDTVKDILTKAYTKFKDVDEINVAQDLDRNILDVYIVREVVAEVEDAVNQISVEAAEEIKGAPVEIGETVEVLTEPIKDFKEKEIVWISENIMNRINNIEKDIIKYEYTNKRNRLVTGTIVKKDDRGNIFVDLGKTIGMLPYENQSPMEHYELDDMIKTVVVDVIGERGKRRKRKDFDPKNIQVFLSRTTPELVKELLAMEVLEVGEGTIEIRRIAREPGYKTKVAVYSDVVDAVATCIGPHGIRVTNVVKELGGEKIDIIRYTEDVRDMIKHSLTPARVDRVIIQDEESQTVFAVVEQDQLAYAYGRQKKNVILAARLCGWKINIKTESEIQEEKIESSDVTELRNVFIEGTPLSELPGLSDNLVDTLNENNIYSVEQLVEIDEQNVYAQIAGIEQTDIDDLKRIISENVEVEEIDGLGEVDETLEEITGTPLSELPNFEDSWIEALDSSGIHTVEQLVEVDEQAAYGGLTGLSDEDKDKIRKILAESVEVEE
jgi:N utilization substance protein A